MIISRTPFRISFFGGGTDYPAFFNTIGDGIVIGTTINRYCYITIRKTPIFFENKYRIVWSKIEELSDYNKIEHPAIRAILKFVYNHKHGLHIHHDADLPARNGLGSSSAFTVGFLNCLYCIMKQPVTKGSIANTAIYLEQKIMNEIVGVQDQILISHGGFNKIDIKNDGIYSITPINLSIDVLDRLTAHIMVFYTGIRRNDNVSQYKAKTYDLFKNDNLKKIAHIARNAYDLLTSEEPSIMSFGEMLDESWLIKRDLNEYITNSSIDEIYLTARKNGAIGGKILGSGGGGFMLLIVPPGNKDKVRSNLKGLHEIDVKFDTEGAKIIYDDEDR